ncbi:MAG: hypothetical protein HZB10_02185 [Candidatus Yonathbacteria bacterium]|nr:hypothetical protein [Candidatus Yonathbacteria bacterium]
MEKIKEYKGIIILILAILAGAFYWYEWRPNVDRKECAVKSNYVDGTGWSAEGLYAYCLRQKGY